MIITTGMTTEDGRQCKVAMSLIAGIRVVKTEQNPAGGYWENGVEYYDTAKEAFDRYDIIGTFITMGTLCYIVAARIK
jgi:hypothetical protein